MIKSKKNHPKIGILRYYNEKKWFVSLEKACNFALFMENKDIRQSLFPVSITLKNGDILNAASGWL